MLPSPIANKIHTEDEIDSVISINGISIEEIERRSVPLLDRTSEKPEYQNVLRCRSSSGFLGPGETFKDRLKKDWKTVRDLGVTHLQLAKHLRNILEQAEATKRKTNKGPDHEITLKYLAADIPHAKEQTLTVGHRFFCGDQWSLFYNPDVSDNESEKWREDHFVSNSWGLSVCLAGGLKGGILNYIENYGFYEGGVENEYRVDPNILYALLSGVLLPEVVQIQMLRVNSRITVLQEEIDHTNFELQNYLKQDADPKEAQKVILSHYHSILNTKLQNMNQLQQQLLYWNSHTTSK